MHIKCGCRVIQAWIENASKTGQFSLISIKPIRSGFVGLAKIGRFEFEFSKF
jgi:hypothetical protein